MSPHPRPYPLHLLLMDDVRILNSSPGGSRDVLVGIFYLGFQLHPILLTVICSVCSKKNIHVHLKTRHMHNNCKSLTIQNMKTKTYFVIIPFIISSLNGQ